MKFDASEEFIVSTTQLRGNRARVEIRDRSTLLPHYEDGPAVMTYDVRDGFLISAIWINQKFNGRHRNGDQPAAIVHQRGLSKPVFEAYYKQDLQHRDGDKPATIHRCRETGGVMSLLYYFEGAQENRSGLPAVQEFDPITGRVVREEFFRDGVRHRDAGPAIVEYGECGEIDLNRSEFYRQGIFINQPK
ncbi:MAG: hypothetical protein AAFQ10_00080 [Pseudomonadota bacterium]